MSGPNLPTIVLILLGTSNSSIAAAPATQASRPSRLTELKQERLACARQATKLADQLYAIGRGSWQSTLECRQRSLAAERDLLDPAGRVESYKRELRLLEEDENLCRSRIAGGMGGNADLPAVEYALAETEMLLAEAVATRPSASASDPLAVKRMKTAQQAYDLALAAWRRGEGPFHHVLLWSQRLLEAQLFLAAGDAERRRVLTDCLEQARATEETATQRYKAGLASELEQRVSKAHRLRAESLLARAEGHSDQAARLLDECVQNLKRAVELSEELYSRGLGGIDELAFVGSRCFDAQAALLSAQGRMADMHGLRRERAQQLKQRETLIQSRAKAGLATEPDLLVSQCDRLDAEILLEESPR